MRQQPPVTVTGREGLRGVLETSLLLGDSEPAALVRLDTGQQVLVPAELLVLQEDGSCYLALAPAEVADQFGVADGMDGQERFPAGERVSGQAGQDNVLLAQDGALLRENKNAPDVSDTVLHVPEDTSIHHQSIMITDAKAADGARRFDDQGDLR